MSVFYDTTGSPGYSELNLTSATFGSSDTAQNGTGFRVGVEHGGGRNRTGPNPFRAKTSEDYGPQVNFTIWLLTALSAAFLALRVYCKFLRHRGLWWDDHVLIAAWLSLVVSNAFVSVSITLGFGRPLSEFNFKNLEIYLLICNLAGTFSILSALWSKTSFAITVLRISSGKMKWLVWFIIITVNLSLGVAVAFTWCQCTPFVKTWQPRVPGECWPKYIQIRFNIFTAIYSGAMDIVLAFVPWKLIWTLTMNKKEKCGVLIAMSMGIFAGVTSIIKITQLPSISNSGFTESTTQLVILGCAEAAITIMAASIPILRALLRDNRPPAGPAQFYHDELYTGTQNSTGTGRSSTVISSRGYHTTTNSTSSRWSKELEAGIGPFRRLSRLSRFSGLNLNFSATTGTTNGTINSNYNHNRNISNTNNMSKNNSNSNFIMGPPGQQQQQHRTAPSSAEDWDFEPPPGMIIQTEEVVVEYETNPEPSRCLPPSQSLPPGVQLDQILQSRAADVGLEVSPWGGNIGRAI
ncbi:hypothetical protein QBC37DRAFT_448614 [Rhypophila decipiens]|uniref:Rhodopsin domain-containing protein n=1 Tax=Rhypophila decipiens TaxID=261697 RepID=A0AAN6Y0Z5_9PEZI|nr:hypothetical protein QBC37DRAFT_448614 [Rhypophila decipiens]